MHAQPPAKPTSCGSMHANPCMRIHACKTNLMRIHACESMQVNKEDLLSMVRYGAELVFSSEAGQVTDAGERAHSRGACVCVCVCLARYTSGDQYNRSMGVAL